jgi:mono/diheme cytochrome c family protein
MLVTSMCDMKDATRRARPKYILGFLLALALLAWIGCSTPQQSARLTASAASPLEVKGADLYGSYCATCHGLDGKGSGPAAAALKVWPPDLTILAKRNGGRFPDGNVYQVIKWGGGIVSHGSREMPVWGNALKSSRISDESELNSRIKALTQYIGSIQTK